jgi:hypothetical protein
MRQPSPIFTVSVRSATMQGYYSCDTVDEAIAKAESLAGEDMTITVLDPRRREHTPSHEEMREHWRRQLPTKESSVSTVWIYVNTSNAVGDVDHLKVFASAHAADEWFAEHDPEGVAFEYNVNESIVGSSQCRCRAERSPRTRSRSGAPAR